MEYNPTKYFRNLLGVLIFCLSFSIKMNAQFTIDTTLTPIQYINNLVVPGVAFSNVQFQGDGQAVGLFNYGGANLGFSQGIMLSTGQASMADDAINNQPFGFLDNGLINIPELAGFVPGCFTPGATNDGVILQFDFIPQSSPISFKYIFASEEYNEYVCSQFNDAFAFLISGPGIVGEQNLAVVPVTGDPISINTINNGNVGASGDPANDPCVTTNSAYFNITPPTDIVYDGYTKVMTAVADVIPCQTYTLRLMLADGCDSGFDSAVFLEANSFGAAPVAITQTTYNSDTTTYEGCAPATLEITIDEPLPNDFVVPFTISGSATNGADYETLPNSFTIPAGLTSATITITALDDGIIEGVETINIDYLTVCGTASTSINISEKPPINLTTGPSQAICSGSGPVTISCSANGGLRPYTYSCLNGTPTAVNDSSYSVNPTATTTYVLQIEDLCGTIDTAHVTVYIEASPIPELTYFPASNTLETNVNAVQYFWYLNGVLIPNATTQFINLEEVGTYSLNCLYSIGCSANSLPYLYFPTGLEEVQNFGLNIQPNPAKDIVNIRIPEFGKLVVTNISGQQVATSEYSKGTHVIHTETWKPGIYLFQFRSSKGIHSAKVLITD